MKTLDTRDLEKRLNELQNEFDSWKDSLTPENLADIKEEYEVAENTDISDEEFNWAWENEVGSDADELKNLIELKDQFGRDQFGREWFDGIRLILEQDFTEFAEDEADQLGLVEDTNTWPYCCIDWQKAADRLMMGYSSVDYDGETYYFRN